MNLDKQVFSRYAEVKNQIKALEAEAKEIQDSVVSEMAAADVDKVESDFGTFYFTSRKTWKYPAYVTKAEEEYQKAKEKAETIGEATYTENKSLAFRGKELVAA